MVCAHKLAPSNNKLRPLYRCLHHQASFHLFISQRISKSLFIARSLQQVVVLIRLQLHSWLR